MDSTRTGALGVAGSRLLPPLTGAALEVCRRIGQLFETARDVILTTHVNPDGDGLGSEAALAAYLQRAGVRARIVNADPAPARFDFLATASAPLGIFRGVEEDGLDGADALVILDTGVAERLGPLAEALPRLRAVQVCIDHHARREPLGDLALVDPAASSTAELVYRLLDSLDARLDPSIAVPLYAGIAFDTGSFRYSNTSPEAHLIAAELCRHGARPEELYARMFGAHSPARMHLWGRALSGLALEAGGRIAWMVVDGALLAATGATREDLEGLVEQGRDVAGVEISILFREDGPAEVKVSFRSRGEADVNALARRFGGGGHVNAAGATIALPRAEAVRRVLAEARRALVPSPAGGARARAVGAGHPPTEERGG